jgi:hypothetical protein
MPLPTPTLSPAAALYDESFFSRPVPIPWLAFTLSLLIFILPFFLIIYFRNLSRLTRTGLWLLPWLPICVAILMIWANYDGSIYQLYCWTAPPPAQRVFTRLFQGASLSFLLGVILLVVNFVRHLVRLRHRPA